MGEIIVRKVRGMNWMAKISLVLIFTLVFSTFMYQGFYKPKQALAAVPSVRAVGTVATATNAVTPGMPTGTLQGDILLLFVETAAETVTVSGGTETWTEVTGSPVTAGTATTGTSLTVFWARASQDAPTSPTTSDSGDHQLARIIAIQGAVPAGDPFDAINTNVETTTDNSGSIAGVTTTGGDRLIVVALAGNLPDAAGGTANFDPWTNGNLAGITERIDNTSGSGNGGALGVATGSMATAGATGNTTVTLAAAAQKAMMTLAIKPATVTATYYADDLTATNVGADGTTNMTTLADRTVTGGASNENRVMMDMTAPAGTTRWRIGEGASDTRTGQEFFRSYTPAYSETTQIAANATAYADFYLRATGTSVVAKATLYEYNDTTGIVGAAKGTASFTGNAASTNRQTMNNASFGNAQFTVASGNRLLVIWSFDMNNTRPAYLWGQGASATPSGYQSITVVESPISKTLTIADNSGTESSNKTVYRNECDQAVDEFTLQATGGDVSVSQIVVTGTNTANLIRAKIYDDQTGSVAHEWDSGDTPVGTTTFSGTTATFSSLGLTITSGTTRRFIVTYDIAPTATQGQTVTGTVTGVTSDAGSTTGTDSGSATLTIGNLTLTIGENTNPLDKTVQQGSTNNAVAAFTFQTTAVVNGGVNVSSVTITGTNTSFVTASGAKLWIDENANSDWDAGDTLIGTTSFSGANATFSGLTLMATPTLSRYIVTYDITTGATVGQTTTGYISGVVSDANTNTNNDNNTDATLTISAGTCTRVAPTVDLGSNQTVTQGGNKQYTVTITNNDTPAAFCGTSSFTLAIQSETGNTASFTLPSILGSTSTGALAAGNSYNTTFTVTAKASATVGHQLTSTVSATDATNHNLLPGSGSVTSTVVSSYTNDNLLHNSSNLASSAWAGSWGIPGGKYGAFVCETCHTKSTTNIKRVRTSISTPDGTNWDGQGSPTTGTITFTQANGTNSNMGDTSATGGWTGVCNVCHSPTYHTNYAYNASNGHQSGTDCTKCHKHSNAFKGEGECIDCHNTAITGNIYNPRNVANDFTANTSRHVFGGTVTNWDCVVCHMEGDEASSDVSKATPKANPKSAYHNEGSSTATRFVNLRNVDAVNSGYQWTKNSTTDTHHTNMDTFCLTCHDSNGASGIAVAAGNNGTTTTVGVAGGTAPSTAEAERPFNSSQEPAAGQLGGTSSFSTKRTRVVDVKTQFQSTTSHHAVLSQRYTSHLSNWGVNGNSWVDRTLKNGTRLITDNIYETARLHCSDCHTVDVNAHGGANNYMMQAATIDATCFLCHKNTEYTNLYPAQDSRFGHAACDHGLDSGMEAIFGQTPGGTNVISACLNCHGGEYGKVPYGGIHGIPDSWGNTTLSNQPYYRFVGGLLTNFMPTTTAGGGTANWTGSGGDYRCYFQSAANSSTNCTRHQGSNNYMSTRNSPAGPRYNRAINY